MAPQQGSLPKKGAPVILDNDAWKAEVMNPVFTAIPRKDLIKPHPWAALEVRISGVLRLKAYEWREIVREALRGFITTKDRNLSDQEAAAVIQNICNYFIHNHPATDLHQEYGSWLEKALENYLPRETYLLQESHRHQSKAEKSRNKKEEKVSGGSEKEEEVSGGSDSEEIMNITVEIRSPGQSLATPAFNTKVYEIVADSGLNVHEVVTLQWFSGCLAQEPIFYRHRIYTEDRLAFVNHGGVLELIDSEESFRLATQGRESILHIIRYSM